MDLLGSVESSSYPLLTRGMRTPSDDRVRRQRPMHAAVGALLHDVVTGHRTVEAARDYYAKEFLDARRKQPTPYMEKLWFTSAVGSAADPDDRILTDEQLNQAEEAGRAKSG